MSAKSERNEEIRRRARAGENLAQLGKKYGVSRQRIDQIVHIDQQRARLIAADAECRGILVRPTHCSLCGTGGAVEMHHDDYSRPLSVSWLCVPCHRQADMARAKKVAEAMVDEGVVLWDSGDLARRVGVSVSHLHGIANRLGVHTVKSGRRYRYYKETDAQRILEWNRNRRDPTKCKHGHRLTPDNVQEVRNKWGGFSRKCKACLARARRKGMVGGFVTQYLVGQIMDLCGVAASETTPARLVHRSPSGDRISATRQINGNVWHVAVQMNDGAVVKLGGSTEARGIRRAVVRARRAMAALAAVDEVAAAA